MTKPVVAVAALTLVEECLIGLDDPVDRLLPELADRRVLTDPHGPFDGETTPARRPIVVRDLLTFELGLGVDVEPWGPDAFFEALHERGLRGPGGIVLPQLPPEPDEWMHRVGTLPLLYQPGARWLYDTGSDILGVLLARASGRQLAELVYERVLGPLGMIGTGFFADTPDGLGSAYIRVGSNPEPAMVDGPGGQWSRMPAFPSGAAGLVSTAADMLAFGQMLLDHGRLPDGSRLVSRATAEAMTTNQIRSQHGPGPSSGGWGLGLGVQTARGALRSIGSYGWEGSLGTSWWNDPKERLVGVVMTTDASPPGAPSHPATDDFWTCLYAALER